MIMTTSASLCDPLICTTLREECEKLLQLAKEIEEKARANSDEFFEDQEFSQLKRAFQVQFTSVHSASCCL